MAKHFRPLILIFLLFGAAVGIANADTVFNFDNSDFATPFMEISNGVTATFTATPAGPLMGETATSFGTIPAAGEFSSFTGNALTNPVSGPWILNVSFNSDAAGISLLFATVSNHDDTQPNKGVFTLSAFENSTLVGSVNASGVLPPGFKHPEGSIGLAGVVFNNVVMSADTPIFAIDDIHLDPVVALEPASFLLLYSGLAGVAALPRRK
jgi:hypothetical protein